MPGAIPFNFLTVQQKLLKIFQNEDDTYMGKFIGIPFFVQIPFKSAGSIIPN